jgi:hypothetical protein
MRNSLIAVLMLGFGALLAAQQAMNNDAVIKLVKAGLSDDLIVTTINGSPAAYDTSADGIIALKNAGASDKVIAAIIARAAAPATPAAPPAAAAMPNMEPLPPPVQNGDKPRVFLQAASKGNQWAAVRDQSMEMSKDFEKDCPGVRITLNQQMADYTVALNHIEVGFSRDNQFQVANKSGDLISHTKEGGSIDGGVKKACAAILDDWTRK